MRYEIIYKQLIVSYLFESFAVNREKASDPKKLIRDVSKSSSTPRSHIPYGHKAVDNAQEVLTATTNQYPYTYVLEYDNTNCASTVPALFNSYMNGVCVTVNGKSSIYKCTGERTILV